MKQIKGVLIALVLFLGFNMAQADTVDDLTVTTGGVTVNAGGLTVSGGDTVLGNTTVTGKLTNLLGDTNLGFTKVADLDVSGGQTTLKDLKVNYHSKLGTVETTGAASFGGAMTANAGITAADGTTTTVDVLNAGATTVTDLTATGDTNLQNTEVNGTLNVVGATTVTTLTASGAASLNDTLTVAGKTALNDGLEVAGSTALNDSLAVAGNTSLNGASNTIGQLATSANTMQGVNNTIHADETNTLQANTNVIGNGGTYAASDAAVQVAGGTGVDIKGAVFNVNTDSTAASANTLGNTNAATTFTASAGNAHMSLAQNSAFVGVNGGNGITATANSTTVSGGSSTVTILTLNDSGASFSKNGAPATVSGVADGVDDYDAANMRQVRSAYAGIASVAALAAIPGPNTEDNMAVGMGVGHYKGESAMAVGFKGRVSNSFNVSAGFGYGSGSDVTSNAGISFSW